MTGQWFVLFVAAVVCKAVDLVKRSWCCVVGHRWTISIWGERGCIRCGKVEQE